MCFCAILVNACGRGSPCAGENAGFWNNSEHNALIGSRIALMFSGGDAYGGMLVLHSVQALRLIWNAPLPAAFTANYGA